MFRAIAIVLTATVLVDACDVFKHGRVSVGVDGLTDKCCGSMSSVTDSILKAAAAGDDNFEAQQEAQNKLVTTLITDCCSSDDQGVLSTLAPEEPPEAAAQINQMCSMGNPSAAALATGRKTLALLQINVAMRASMKQDDQTVKFKDRLVAMTQATLGDRTAKQVQYELNMPTEQLQEKSKTTLAIICFFGLNGLGFDRCFMGQTFLGIVKGITLGGIGIWALVDYFVILINMLTKAPTINYFGFVARFPESELDTSFMITVVALVSHAISAGTRMSRASSARAKAKKDQAEAAAPLLA